MRNFLVLLLLILAAAAGYFVLGPTTQPVSQEPVAATEPDELSKMAAKRHIETITQAPAEAINVGEADHFVSKDQLLQLPESKTQAQAGTEVLQEDNATSFAVELNSFGNRNQSESQTTRAQGQIIRADELRLGKQIRLNELLNDPDNSGNTLFYIHGVTDGDDQGLWGIIQKGLMHTFSKGIQVNQGRVTADIPLSADERLANSTSSFLGSILDRKVKDTYVYNYEKGILGQNPDLISPGQELIIVTFTEDELISIYKHFAEQNSQ